MGLINAHEIFPIKPVQSSCAPLSIGYPRTRSGTVSMFNSSNDVSPRRHLAAKRRLRKKDGRSIPKPEERRDRWRKFTHIHQPRTPNAVAEDHERPLRFWWRFHQWSVLHGRESCSIDRSCSGWVCANMSDNRQKTISIVMYSQTTVFIAQFGVLFAMRRKPSMVCRNLFKLRIATEQANTRARAPGERGKKSGSFSNVRMPRTPHETEPRCSLRIIQPTNALALSNSLFHAAQESELAYLGNHTTL